MNLKKYQKEPWVMYGCPNHEDNFCEIRISLVESIVCGICRIPFVAKQKG